MQVNTWLLIARRVMPSHLVTILFFATWIIVRNLFFPWLIYPFWLEYRAAAAAAGTPTA
jgi:hypothetical protein